MHTKSEVVKMVEQATAALNSMTPEQAKERLKKLMPHLFEPAIPMDKKAERKAKRLCRKIWTSDEKVDIFTDKHKARVVVMMWGLLIGFVSVAEGKCDPLIWCDRDGDTMELEKMLPLKKP